MPFKFIQIIFETMNKLWLIILFIAIISSSCSSSKQSSKKNVLSGNRTTETIPNRTTTKVQPAARPLQTMDKPLIIDRKEFLNYAKQFLNVPYLYASDNPEKGFDCSGFLFHVFKYFNVKAPRASYNYENLGKEVTAEKSNPGDIILFTASDPAKIGHMGIITETGPTLSFIHASTSKGVIISQLSEYYQKHFVKIIRVIQ